MLYILHRCIAFIFKYIYIDMNPLNYIYMEYVYIHIYTDDVYIYIIGFYINLNIIGCIRIPYRYNSRDSGVQLNSFIAF